VLGFPRLPVVAVDQLDQGDDPVVAVLDQVGAEGVELGGVDAVAGEAAGGAEGVDAADHPVLEGGGGLEGGVLVAVDGPGLLVGQPDRGGHEPQDHHAGQPERGHGPLEAGPVRRGGRRRAGARLHGVGHGLVVDGGRPVPAPTAHSLLRQKRHVGAHGSAPPAGGRPSSQAKRSP
jgi:hypothetical protein